MFSRARSSGFSSGGFGSGSFDFILLPATDSNKELLRRYLFDSALFLSHFIPRQNRTHPIFAFRYWVLELFP